MVERNVNPGMEVRPDRDAPLFVVSDLKKLTVLMAGLRSQSQQNQAGTKAIDFGAGLSGRNFSGHGAVHRPSAGREDPYRCRCVAICPIRTARLLPGMYATITVESDPGDRAFVIPLTAVFTEGDADYVFIALDDNHYQQRPVEIALRLKDKAVITGGLQPNEQLVTEGALMLRAEEEVETDSAKP